jgi:hypothetical protein
MARFMLCSPAGVHMRTFAISVGLALVLAGCQKTTTETSTTDGNTTTTVKTTTTTDTVNMPSIDTAATANAKAELKDAGEKTKEAAREAAHATGAAIEKAGKKIQEKTGEKKP